MLNIKIKKTHENAVIPTQIHIGDAYDLTAVNMVGVDTGEYGYLEYDTGWAMEIPEGYRGKIYPRSSISKTGLIQSNAVGIIDPGYRGNITIRFKAIPGTKIYEVGDRIGQIVIEKHLPITWEVVNELSESTRSTGSYGSTGA